MLTGNIKDANGGYGVSVAFTPGSADQATRIGMGGDERLPRPLIAAGVMPYLAFDVLYDPDRRLIGLRARPPLPNGPTPSASPP